MHLHDEIAKAFIAYLKALYTEDYKSLYSFLYQDDLQKMRDTMVSFAHKMDEFGETEGLLRQLGLSSIADLEKLSLYDYTIGLIKLSARKVGQKVLKKILEGFVITNVEETGFNFIVSYEYPVLMFDEWERYNGEVRMIKVDEDWKIFLKSGLEAGLSVYQKQIDDFFAKKELDNMDNFTDEESISKFSYVGYRNFDTGKTIFEPRFADAGEFNEGLAYAKAMRKYGYIDLKGEFAIKPQFIEAKDFSQKKAGVRIASEDGSLKWGFINPKGKMVIEPQFDEVSNFSESMCAVRIDEYWGYINTKGDVVVPCTLESAEDFENGYARIAMYNEDYDDVMDGVVDKKGNPTFDDE